MIDTLRFKIHASDSQYKLIKEKCAILSKTRKEETIFRFISDNLRLGSYDRNVNIQVRDEGVIFIEFSVPKYLYGHNIYLLYPQQLPGVIYKLHKDLVKYFDDFPSPEYWFVQRLDVCYSWALKNQDEVDRAITLFHSFSYPRKDIYYRDSSIMFIGPAYSVKFYKKWNEFKVHDYAELVKDGKRDIADKLYKLSEGVLRFEASLRKQSVIQEFGDRATYRDISDPEFITKLLNFYLKKYFSYLDKVIMSAQEITKRLVNKYGKTRGVQLFQFYTNYFSTQPLYKVILKENYSRTQIHKNLLAIRKAEVGLLEDEFRLNFDFSIPSKDVVNPDEPI